MSETKQAISLEKDEKIDITKGTGLTKLYVGAGWDEISAQPKYDLDVFAIMLSAGKLASDSSLYYYGNKKSADGSIQLSEDNLTGQGDGDDEFIKIDLSKIPANVDRVLVGINIYEASNRGQKFGAVKNAFMRLVNEADQVELCRYDLSEDYSKYVGVHLGEIYRHNGEWKFQAIGKGFETSLRDFALTFK